VETTTTPKGETTAHVAARSGASWAGSAPSLGHYVRFNPEDLEHWLRETRVGPPL
jgi:hypothetical protein